MPSLLSLVGPVPANFNMLPWPGPFATATDFTTFQTVQQTHLTYANTRSSISTGIPAPDGSTNAQQLVESSANGTHFVQNDNGLLIAGVFPISRRIAVIAQAAGRSRIVVFDQNIESVDDTTSIGFDLAGGNVGYDNSVGANATLIDAAMTDLGGGWWLCYFDVTNSSMAGGNRTLQPQINLDNGSGTAARSISYTGNGSSGVNIWWFNMLPTAAWTLGNLAFHDHFSDLSTIDINNTKAPGFKWYVNNLFPTSFMPTFGWATNPPSSPTLPGTLSISSPSILKIYNPDKNQTGFSSQIWSVVDDGAGGYIGFANQPPLAFDGYFNWDGIQADYSTNWQGNPAFWSMPTEALTNTGLSPTSHFTEWDVVEGAPLSATFGGSSTIHDWSNPSSPVNVQAGGGGGMLMNPGAFLRISGIWIPIDATGYGSFMQFVNGQVTGCVPYASGSNYSHSDTQHMTVFLDTAENATSNAGGGWPMYIDWVRVYTAGSPPPPTQTSKTKLSLGIGLGLTLN